MKERKYKIIFAAKDRGGLDAVFPVFEKIKVNDNFYASIILDGPAKEIAAKRNVKFLDCSNFSILDFEKVVEKIMPDIIFTGSSRGFSPEKKLIRIAQKYKIITSVIVDYWGNSKERFGEKFDYLPDYVFVIDDAMKRGLIKEGIDKNKIVVTGNPRFDRFKNYKTAGEDKNLVVFYSQPFLEIRGRDFNEVKIFKDIVEVLENICPEKRVVIKFHPSEKNKNKFDDIIRSSALRINIEKKLEAYDLTKRAGIVLGINSMALFDAALMGKKVLSYQPGVTKENDALKSNFYGASIPIYRKEDLFSVLKKLIEKKSKNNLNFRKKYTLNNSTQKVINFIKEVSTRNPKLIIFDFDRTLVNLNVDWALVRQNMHNFCKVFGITFKGNMPLFQAIKSTAESVKNKKLAEELYKNLFVIIKKRELESVQSAELIPGAREFLGRLSGEGIKFVVFSNNHHQAITEIFKKFKLPKPGMIIGSDDVRYQKPNPEGLKKIFKKMGTKPNECLFVGDSRIDFETGKSMDVKTIILEKHNTKIIWPKTIF